MMPKGFAWGCVGELGIGQRGSLEVEIPPGEGAAVTAAREMTTRASSSAW